MVYHPITWLIKQLWCCNSLLNKLPVSLSRVLQKLAYTDAQLESRQEQCLTLLKHLSATRASEAAAMKRFQELKADASVFWLPTLFTPAGAALSRYCMNFVLPCTLRIICEILLLSAHLHHGFKAAVSPGCHGKAQGGWIYDTYCGVPKFWTH